ncbi:MAG: hypothetical protein ACQKBU_00520 [Verrucomicrobiales bacterium]
MNPNLKYALGALLIGVCSNFAAAESDCTKLAVQVKHAVSAKPDDVLVIVESQVAAHSGCACEIVKAAIEASKADSAEVAAIVEVAAQTAPDQMRIVSQCAVAVAPDALTEVQMVMARLEPAKGEVAHDSAKSPKTPVEVKPAWNPLDFPGQGIGPNPGGPGGLPWLPPTTEVPPGRIPPVVVPPVIEPPVGTETDPGSDSGTIFPTF